VVIGEYKPINLKQIAPTALTHTHTHTHTPAALTRPRTAPTRPKDVPGARSASAHEGGRDGPLGRGRRRRGPPPWWRSS